MNSSTAAAAAALTSIPTNPTDLKCSFARNSTLRDSNSSITGTHPAEEMEENVKYESFAANLNPSSPRSAITTHSDACKCRRCQSGPREAETFDTLKAVADLAGPTSH